VGWTFWLVTLMLRLNMSNVKRSASAANTYHNRVGAIMLHLTRYNSGATTSRLAAHAGLSKSTVSKLIHGKTNPLYVTAHRVVKCLEAAAGRRLKYDEVFSISGAYPTAFVCTLMRCPGCIPPWLFELHDGITRSGKWSGDCAEFSEELGRQAKFGDLRT